MSFKKTLKFQLLLGLELTCSLTSTITSKTNAWFLFVIPFFCSKNHLTYGIFSSAGYECSFTHRIVARGNNSKQFESVSILCIFSAGVFVQADFISSDEEAELVAGMEAEPWVESQSGRRKQDFGPKINFKKKKVKADAFQGFPAYSKTVMDRLKTISCLSEFQPVEMCNLEYLPSRGASIDPHHDDFWIWGERLVTVNLLSDTVYSLTLRDSDICVKVPVPQRCIVVLYGEARNVYMHSISRSDITSHRIGITIREFTPPFLEGGELYFMGKRILDKATIRELSPPDNDIQLPGH